jgi:hypothetical protein
MRKTANVIVRVDPELKSQVEEACAYLDITLSSIVRSTMMNIVRQYHSAKANDTAYARAFMEGEHAQFAYDALKRELQAQEASKEQQPPAPENLPPRQPGPRIYEDGSVDPTTISRKLRRKFARDRAKGRV